MNKKSYSKLTFIFISVLSYIIFTGASPFPFKPYAESKSAVHHSDFNQGGRYIAAGTIDNTVTIWEYPNKRIKASFEVPFNFSKLRISPNGNYIALTISKSLWIYDIQKNEFTSKIIAFDDSIEDICFSPNNRIIATSGTDLNTENNSKLHLVKTWEINSGKLEKQFPSQASKIEAIAFNQHGKMIAAALGKSGLVKVWDVNSKKLIHTISLKNPNNPSYAASVAFSPDDKLIAIGSNDFTAYLFKLKTGNLKKIFKADETLAPNTPNLISQIIFDFQGKYLFTSNRNINVWSIKTGLLITIIPDPFEAKNNLAISRNGKTLIAGTADPKALFIKTWDLSELNINKRFSKLVKKSLSEWEEKEEFESQEAYNERIKTKTNKYNEIIEKTLFILHSHIANETKIIFKDKNRELIKIKIPMFFDIELNAPKDKFDSFTKHFHELEFKDLQVEKQDNIHENTTWRIKSLKIINPKTKDVFYYSYYPALPKNTSHYPNLNKKFLEAQQKTKDEKALNLAKLGLIYYLGEGITTHNEEALKWTQKAASENEPLALFTLSRMTQEGLGIEKDPKKAQALIIKALPLLNNQAQKRPDKDISYALAVIYENGLGVPQDMKETIKWYRKSADQGLHRSQFWIGKLYEQGTDDKPDYKEAIKWFRLSANQGNPKAQYKIGRYTLNGTETRKNSREAAEWFYKSALQDYALANYELGLLYKNGIGLTKNFPKAITYLQKAAEKNHVSAMYELGHCFENGLGTKKNMEEANKWYSAAAKKGNTNALHSLGVIAESNKKFITAQKWFQKAAKKENPESAFKLSMLLLNKDNKNALSWLKSAAEKNYGPANYQLALQSKNPKTAIEYYQKAAAQDHTESQYILGQAYEFGRNVATDNLKAMLWYKNAAKKNHKKAAYHLAKLYITELRAPKKGLSWYRKAVENEKPELQLELAKILDDGILVPEMNYEAAIWYEKAAKKNHPEAQMRLGEMYLYGKEIAENPHLAFLWLNKSANYGYAKAQTELGKMYALGKGVAKNKGAALEWFQKAAAQEYEEAHLILGKWYLEGNIVTENKAKAIRFLVNANQKDLEELDNETGMLYLQQIKSLSKISKTKKENIAVEKLAETGMTGYKNGITRTGTKQFREAIAKDALQLYLDNYWYSLNKIHMPLILASEYHMAIYNKMKKDPAFWCSYAHVANLAGQPEIALIAIEKAKQRLNVSKIENKKQITDFLQIQRALAYMLNGNSEEALEGLYSYGKLAKENPALINYINHWAKPLLYDKKQLTFVTGIPQEKWTGNYAVTKPQKFYNIITKELIKAPAIKLKPAKEIQKKPKEGEIPKAVSEIPEKTTTENSILSE